MASSTGAKKSLIELKVPTQPEFLRVVRLMVSGYLSRLPMSIEEVENVKVAVSEACNNAMQYAYLDDQEGTLTLRCWHAGDRLVFEVTDMGRGFDPARGDAPHAADDEHGLGFLLIQTLMDNVQVDSSPDTGTVVTMTKQFSR